MKITVYYDKRKLEYTTEKCEKLSDILISLGADIPLNCGGIGKCGKCAVSAKGSLSPITPAEKELFGDKNEANLRLACLTYAEGDCEVSVQNGGEVFGTADFSAELGKNPLTGNRSCYAAVIDIGTTTVAYLLYKMPEGELVKSAVHKNSQSVFGADVVSRISYAENNAGNGVKTLQKRICDQIDNNLNDFGYPVDFRVVTGNTAMLHFYRGLSVNSLAKAPFEVNEYFGVADGEVCVPRCISAFVGADVTCGIISSGMLSDNCSMLIDIGTNGEIVLKNGSEFSCCSASAGPAFEGASISNGVASVSGAICSVFNVGSSFYYKTIGGEKPCGICGSGLIDAVASMLKADIVDKDGYLERDFYIGDSGISISPADIRAVQIAKAAIRAAIETICPDLSKVQNFYISGSFGSYLNIDNAILIGLFPREMKGKVTLCGNTAAAGASMMLLDKAQFEKGNEIARSTKTLTLASNEVFYEKYIRYLSLQ